MSVMTKIEGCPDRDSVKPGMAHFQATGPAGTRCGECRHLQRQATKSELFRCSMFQRLTGKIGNCIKREFLSCKYFEPRAK